MRAAWKNLAAAKVPVFIGLDLGGTDLKYGLVNSSGKVLVSRKIRARSREGRKFLVEQLRAAAAELLSVAKENRWRVARIGVGSPGAVNFRTGKIFGNCPNIPDWVGVNLKKSLAGFGIAVQADNDANCVALAESRFGAARKSKSTLCVTVGTGIGGGLILDGQVYRGASFSAGEIGHTTIVFNGKKCACGNRGCLEKYASVSALLEAARWRLGSKQRSGLKKYLKENGRVTVGALIRAAKKGERAALKLIGQQAAYLGAGLASAINLLNPEGLILGGGFIDVYPPFLKLVEEEIRRRAFPAALVAFAVSRAELGNEAGVVGAAFLGSE